MIYKYQKPHPLLADYVRTVLTLDGSSRSNISKVPLFTNGMSAMMCRTEKDQQGNENVLQLTLFGKSTPPESWVVNQSTTIIAYFFYPFALASTFNMSAADLAKNPLDLYQSNPHQTTAIRSQLLYAASADEKCAVLDNLLIHQLSLNGKECAIIKVATDYIMHDPGPESLSTLINKLNLNERTFQRLFKKYVGITASQYRRICQFQLSLSQLRHNRFSNLTDVAYDNGFADQSHFSRSFREFTKITPGDYLSSGLK